MRAKVPGLKKVRVDIEKIEIAVSKLPVFDAVWGEYSKMDLLTSCNTTADFSLVIDLKGIYP